SATGNVGIGTLNPVTPLTIYNAAGMGHLTIQSNDNPTVSSRADIDFHVVTTGHMMSRISGYYESSVGGGFGGLFLSTNYNGTISERMRILSNGNVGIGTITPQAKLHVSGSTKISSNIQAQTGGALILERQFSSNQDYITLDGDAGYIGIPANENYLNVGSLNQITFSPGGYASQIIFDKTGSVGIGTTTPGSYKLAVEGKLGARKVVVTQAANWPDYVFDSSYT
ncbi:hypothetical protein ACI6Q2_23455, partial [Chitinophagaceae bacterium LWZ2-11]